MKTQNLTYVNEENEQVGLFLLNTLEGKKIWSMSQTSDELESLVRKYHRKNGIANWKFADNYDEGIDWACFGDLFNNLKNNYKL